jgi:hypothetical protein
LERERNSKEEGEEERARRRAFKKNVKRERNSESEVEEMESLRESDGEYENPKQEESG